MANQLDELQDEVSENRDVRVINKKVKVEVGVGSTIFQILLFVFGIIPGLVFLIMKVKAKSYLLALEQRLQHDASQIDNYLEQRVMILQNAAKLLDKAISLDKDTFEVIAKYRSNSIDKDNARNEVQSQLDNVSSKINVAFENYPELKAHGEIADVMQQNAYLQKEITAAREVYNDTVNQWNRDIFEWPTKMIVAAKQGYTTRIPFSTTNEIREQARQVFF